MGAMRLSRESLIAPMRRSCKPHTTCRFFLPNTPTIPDSTARSPHLA